MSPLTALVVDPTTLTLARVLVHFLWQGAALALIAFAVTRWLTTSAVARYAIGVATLGAMLAAPFVTFVALQSAPAAANSANTRNPLVVATIDASTALVADAAAPTSTAVIPSTLPIVVLAWLLGVALLSVRLVGGWMVARRLVRRAVGPVTPDVQRLAHQVAERLQLRRLVRIVESSTVSVPIMVGWLKPVVLLPAAALSGLTPTQLEGLLAHELAHIRRHDYVVNLLQSIVETLLFYHPAVWWVSRQIRVEREHCCDDLAVGICNRLVYVSALANLATMATPRLALAATDGPLLHRVRRLLRTSEADSPVAGSVSLVVLLLIVACVVPVMLVSAQSSNPTPATTAPIQAAATTPPMAGTVRADVSAPTSAGLSVTRATTPGKAMDVPVVTEGRTVAPTVQAGLDRPVDAGVAEAQTAADVVMKQVAELEERLKDLGQQRRSLERQKAEADLKSRLEGLRREIDGLRAERDRALQLVVAVDPIALSDLNHKIALTEEIIRTVETDAKFKFAAQDLQQRQEEQAGELERRSKEYAEILAKLEDLRQMKLAAEMRKKVESAQADAEATAKMLSERAAIQPPGTRVAAGDILTVEIQGEDALPRAYTVANDGTIRLPLLGAVRVRELTSAQVENAIAKQLVERRLGATQKVGVTVRRR